MKPKFKRKNEAKRKEKKKDEYQYNEVNGET